MNTIAEIGNAIEKPSPAERRELERLLWPKWVRPEADNLPTGRARLVERDPWEICREASQELSADFMKKRKQPPQQKRHN